MNLEDKSLEGWSFQLVVSGGEVKIMGHLERPGGMQPIRFSSFKEKRQFTSMKAALEWAGREVTKHETA